MLEGPFSWGAIGILLTFLLAILVPAVGLMNPPVWIAKACISISAIVILVWSIWAIRSITAQSSFSMRAILTFIFFGLIGIGWIELLHLVDIRFAQQIPDVVVNLFIDNMVSDYPQQCYNLSIMNRNHNSATITGFSMVFNFRNTVVRVESEPILDTGGNIVGPIKYYEKKQGGTKTIYEEKVANGSITKNFTLSVGQLKVDDKIVNTNFVKFECERWPENSFYTACIYIDLTKQPEIVKGNLGIYEGEYHYIIGGQKYSKKISGIMPCSAENNDKWEEKFSNINPQEGTIIFPIHDNWIKENNRFVEIIPHIIKGRFEIHVYIDNNNILRVLISNSFSNRVNLKYDGLHTLDIDPIKPKHVLAIRWGNGANILNIDDHIVDRWPK